MDLKQLTEILKGLKSEILWKYKADLKGVFGSQARGEAGEESDIDVLAEFRDGATLLDLSGMRIFLEERLAHKVDVVCQNSVREEIRPYIYKDLVTL